METKNIKEVRVAMLPVSGDHAGNPIVPLELININNKVKYIKEKVEQLLQINRSTINEKEIEIQIIKIKDYLDRLMHLVLSHKNEYKERLEEGYSEEKLKEKYGCTQEEWEKNFTYSDEFNMENSLRNYLRYLKNNIRVMHPTVFSKTFKKDYRKAKDYIDATKKNRDAVIKFINHSLRLLTNIENVIKDLQHLEKPNKKENPSIEPSKGSIATYLSRLYTILEFCNTSNACTAEQVEFTKEYTGLLEKLSNVIKSENAPFFIRKAISSGSVRKAEKVFSMKKEEWDEFIASAKKMDYIEFLNKLLDIFKDILEYTKKENMGKPAIEAAEKDIAYFIDAKKSPSTWEECIETAENGVKWYKYSEDKGKV